MVAQYEENSDSNASMTTVQDVRVLNEMGLHARPAGKLAAEAQKFNAQIQLGLGEQCVDAKSILDILTLAASQGSELQIRAEGDDAHDAVVHLSEFFKTRFGEDK